MTHPSLTIRLSWLLLTWLASTWMAATCAHALDTVYLVRHAEKVEYWPPGLDAFHPLSREGVARAERLAERLADAGIAAIYTSTTTRTLATGMPLAEAAGIPIGPDDRSVARPRMKEFFDQLRETHPDDRAVLVVGHSNTVPLLLAALGAERPCFESLDVDPVEQLIRGYEGLWVIDLKTSGCAGIERQILK